MRLSRINPWSGPLFNQLNRLHSEMNRLFERWPNEESRFETFPPVNLWEEADGFRLEAELPGLKLEDLDITVTGRNQLTIKGERKPEVTENGQAHRQERMFGSFVRTLTLPALVDENKVEARIEHGVLHVYLPKHEAAKPRKIQVKG
ncbi:MAG: Hsp20/alpha crystallin family protein [Gemmataceae bacterium]|nr:Hsp20/alpha crystallin family protein [Gemmataceae bacterium]